MKLFSVSSLISLATAAAAAAAAGTTTTATTKSTDEFQALSVCGLQTKKIQCLNNSTRIDIGAAIYGQFRTGKQCLKKFERAPKNACLKAVTTRISKMCRGKTSCKLSTKKLPTNCKSKGSKKLYVLYACGPRHRYPAALKKIMDLYRRSKLNGASRKQRLRVLRPHSTAIEKYMKTLKLKRNAFRKRALQRLKKEFRVYERDAELDNLDEDADDDDDDDDDNDDAENPLEDNHDNSNCNRDAHKDEKSDGDDAAENETKDKTEDESRPEPEAEADSDEDTEPDNETEPTNDNDETIQKATNRPVISMTSSLSPNGVNYTGKRGGQISSHYYFNNVKGPVVINNDFH